MRLLWLLACAGSPDSGAEREAYLEAVTLAATDPLAAAASCEQAGELRGECLATLLDQAPTESASAVCERIEAGPWHDECWFLAAERAARLGDSERSAGLCKRAGGFAEECVSHAWYAEALRLLQEQDAQQALVHYPAAWDWRPAETAEADRLASMFWEKFFEASLNHADTPPLDRTWCSEIAQLGPEVCQQLMLRAVRKDLRRVKQRGLTEQRERLCEPSLPVHVRARDGLGLTYVQDPQLDRVVRQQLRGFCEPR